MTQTTTPAQWAKQITTAWRSSLAGILRCGRLLIAAKRKLAHGEFMRMVENELPFSPSTAERLMRISADRRLANPAHAPILPAAWFTLYRLSLLSDEEFDAAIADGRINPEMERGDIEPGPKETSEPQPPTKLVTYYVPPSNPQPLTKIVPYYVREAPARPPLPYESMTAPATQADRVIEAIEQLGEQLDEATASEVVGLLRARGEDFTGAIRGLQALADLAARCGAVD